MTILLKEGTTAQILYPQSFGSEQELEDVLAQNPNLLADDQGTQVAIIMRQVTLEAVGRLDILLTDADGLPIIVEVKLSRNGESRREIIAQAIDYVSGLSTMTVDEIDEAVSGALESALRSFSASSNADAADQQFETRWRNFGRNLRSGTIRLVLTLDEVQDDLVRVMSFLSERSDLDVQLLTLQKFLDSNKQAIYVPKTIVSKPAERGDVARVISRSPSPMLQAVLNEYIRLCGNDMPSPSGQAAYYRYIKLAGWPSLLHYEFLTTKETVRCELHIESETVRPLGIFIEKLSAEISNKFPTGALKWDPNWSNRRGRILVDSAPGASEEQIAECMILLIKLTKGPIENELRRLRISEPT